MPRGLFSFPEHFIFKILEIKHVYYCYHNEKNLNSKVVLIEWLLSSSLPFKHWKSNDFVKWRAKVRFRNTACIIYTKHATEALKTLSHFYFYGIWKTAHKMTRMECGNLIPCTYVYLILDQTSQNLKIKNFKKRTSPFWIFFFEDHFSTLLLLEKNSKLSDALITNVMFQIYCVLWHG